MILSFQCKINKDITLNTFFRGTSLSAILVRPMQKDHSLSPPHCKFHLIFTHGTHRNLKNRRVRNILDRLFLFLFLVSVTEILGYKPLELLGKSWVDFYHPDDVDYMGENYQQGKQKIVVLFTESMLLIHPNSPFCHETTQAKV